MAKKILLILVLLILLLPGCRPKESVPIESPAIVHDEESDDVPVIVQEEHIIDTVPEAEETSVTPITTEEATELQEEEEEGFFSSLYDAFTNSMNEVTAEQTEVDQKEELQSNEEEPGIENNDDSVTAPKQEEVNTKDMEENTVCSSNIYNCDDFSNWNEANNVYQECGGQNNDIHRLDSDGNDIPCESLSGAPAEETTEEETNSINSKSYICSTDTYNCGDFLSYSEALAAYEACGGLSNDVHDLDRDHDGEPCESLK